VTNACDEEAWFPPINPLADETNAYDEEAWLAPVIPLADETNAYDEVAWFVSKRLPNEYSYLDGISNFDSVKL
jgi:hypothetical protein